MPTLEQQFAERIAAGLASRSLTKCSRWSAYRRVMGSPFPGPYSFKYHPWCRELHDSVAPETWCMKGAQLGVTEAAINRALYTIDQLKRDVLYVLPTQGGASDFSKARFGAALENSEYLKSIFTDTNSVALKRASANTLYIRGSRGRGGLKSVPVSELILDEMDEMDLGKVWLALERLSGQLTKHVWGLSTPTIPDYGIARQYKGSTAEHFVFTCPHCGKKTELIWPDCVEIVGDHFSDPRINDSFLKCKECKAKLDQEDKPNFLTDGSWVPTATNPDPNIRGFYINQLYSFTISAAELVAGYFRGFGDEIAAAEFSNSKLGLPFLGDGAKITDDMITRSIRDYSMNDVRPRQGGKRLITLGGDQGKTSWVWISEWLRTKNAGKDISASYEEKVLWVGKFGQEEYWRRLTELMREWQVLYAVIDADPEISDARAWCKSFEGYAAITRYRAVKATKEIVVSEEETGCPMLIADRTQWLSTSLGRFKSTPTRIQLPRDIPEECKRHLKALTRTYQRPDKTDKTDKTDTNVAIYVSTEPDDHYAHAMTYAEMALQFAPSLGSRNLGKLL
jgi:hypothetical protein